MNQYKKTLGKVGTKKVYSNRVLIRETIEKNN